MAADAVDTTLLELGIDGWSLLEDAIAKRAWIVGIFASEAEAVARWRELSPMLGLAPLIEPEFLHPSSHLGFPGSIGNIFPMSSSGGLWPWSCCGCLSIGQINQKELERFRVPL